MATTLLRKKHKVENHADEFVNLLFQTYIAEVNGKEVPVLKISIVNDSLEPQSECILNELQPGTDEETFHREIRQKAALMDHLVTSHSTNPEWNPENYRKNLEDCIKNGY